MDVDAHGILGHLFALDEQVSYDEVVTLHHCKQLGTLMDMIDKLEGAPKLDWDLLYMYNELEIASEHLFYATLDDTILQMSMFAHPVPDDSGLF
jgi:hypothetical protein